MANVEEYIRRSAIARGIDPDVAVRVAMSEGGLKNPFRRGEGPAPRSQAAGLGATENSFGPFQLYISGNNAGLGDRALKAGIDPRENWQGGIDFALDAAAREGWGAWYGAKNVGISPWQGINRGGAPAKIPGTTMASAAPAVYAPPDGPKGKEEYLQPLPTREIADRPIAPIQDGTAVATAAPVDQPGFFQPAQSIGDTFKNDGVLAGFKAMGDNPGISGGLGILAGMLKGSGDSGGSPIPPAPALQPNRGDNQAAAALMANILQKKKGGVPGLSLMG